MTKQRTRRPRDLHLDDVDWNDTVDGLADDEIQALCSIALKAMRTGQGEGQALFALMSTLSLVVAYITIDLDGIDFFMKMFHEDTRRRWLSAQEPEGKH